MSSSVILTGLRANNDLHIGNYFGALVPIIDLANNQSKDYQINLFVPDLHSFTTPIDHSLLQTGIFNNLKTYLAAGLPIDKSNVYIYRQSYIPAHSELAIILSSFTSFGEMSKMTQFKEKVDRIDFRAEIKEIIKYITEKKYNLHNAVDYLELTQSLQTLVDSQENETSVGLFTYPILMAADILLYGAKYVPVGEDQTQHLEFTRDIAQRFNNRFGEVFTIPAPVKEQHNFFGKDQGLRIKDLQDPTKKMSKSNITEKGIIFMHDSLEVAKSKIRSATTDSKAKITYDKQAQPGLANLLEILALVSAEDLNSVITRYQGQTSYGPLKEELADKVVKFLNKFQTSYNSVNYETLMSKLRSSELAMNKQANLVLLKVQKAVGLRS
jgi:tryptophanyl-tRNA synthetase